MTDQVQNLDGKSPVKAVPFDAHEQATRGEAKVGDEYPKAVDHVDHPDPVAAAAGHQEPVVVNSAEEEEQYLAAKADEAKAEQPA